MLIFNETKFVKTPFANEAELEAVVIKNFEFLFGPNSIFLPKTLIKTANGGGTIPDGFAIDIAQEKWYLVEAELIHHSVWSHIAPQITKQLLASHQPQTKEALIDLSVKLYRKDNATKEKFDELNILEIDVRKVLANILATEPIIGVPIDGITDDLKDWARTLKYKVKLWLVSKFVEFNNPQNVIFELPEEFKPELDTETETNNDQEDKDIKRYDVAIIDLIENNLLAPGDTLHMSYKPRNGILKIYETTVLEDGSLKLLGQVFSSPSYAALIGINDAGSTRPTVNGWVIWKTSSGKTLADLREELLLLKEQI